VRGTSGIGGFEVTSKTKRIFVAFTAGGSDQSLFYRLWRLRNMEGPLSRHPHEELTPHLEKVASQVEQYAAQMRRQQEHINDIKRLCHVPID